MRKIPQQQRSKALVSRLVEATAQAIREHGMDKFTTHHVAELAGVSVGSLYQYFDSPIRNSDSFIICPGILV